MTTEVRYEEVLEIIGLDVTRKDMVVLGALIKAQKEPTDFINFETIRKQLAKDEGSRKGKDSLIYRSLSWLEKEGFLKIDKGGHKHGYNSTVAIIEKAVEKIVNRNVRSLEKELEKIDSEITSFSEMNSDVMASGLIDHAAGKIKIEKSVFAQGWDNILKLLENKVYDGLKKGDVVRVKLEWMSEIDYLESRRVMRYEELLGRGVEIRALDHDRGEKRFRLNMKKVLNQMQSRGGKVGCRVLPRTDATYQFIGRNTEGIVLIVSESPLSATWLPRSSNAELVDNAIDNFDSDYEKGTDLLEFEG
ncbi:MAG: hypothetical protein PVJ05_07195 [Candidatus Thorarchaeota archaeon]